MKAPAGREAVPSLETLSPVEKRALLTRLVQEQPAGVRTAPLSYAQQRLWFLDQLVADNPFYNESSALRLMFPLDTKALRDSLNEIVRRHEALRTTFHAMAGRPLQRVAAALELEMTVVDLEPLPAADREARALQLAREEARSGFDLARGPLIRTRLLRLGPDDHVFLLTMHHIICDGWSMQVFFNELKTLYASFCARQPSPLPALRIQYTDFAVWQRNWLQGTVLDDQLAYWRTQLANLPPLELPTDRHRPAIPSFVGGREVLRVSTAAWQALERLCEREGVTAFMGLLAAFQTLLFRYSGQEDIAVGSPIANRNRAEVEGLIGFFVNTLVLRTDLSGNPTFQELLARVREVALGAYNHQDLPFEKLVEELQPERDLSRNPLFQATFQLLSVRAEPISERILRSVEVDVQTSKFDLRCDMWTRGGSLEGHLEYSADLFDPATIERMARHFEILLEGIAAAPARRLSELPLLSAGERHTLLVEWNDTSVSRACEGRVHQWFEEQARRRPEALAVSDGRRSLSYGELNRRANRLAHHLRSRGVGPGVLVALCMERSLELVLGAVAVLKAAGAYVPLDPASPPERLAAMLRDCQVPIVLTKDRWAVRIPLHGARRLALDGDWGTVRGGDDDLPARGDCHSLAYVIFTSGSTGQPRGVELRHGGLANLVCWHQREYAVEASDRATLLAAPAFDASVWEIWPYLASGASLHIPDEETHASPAKLVRWLAAEGITLCFLPTPVAEQALDEAWPDDVRLRAMLVGGDKLHRAPPRSVPFSVVNHYGPTEYTVVGTFAPVDPVRDANSPPPIGRPIGNTRAYVLDRYLNPVPVGVAGELHLAGDGLARGYLNRPELTAEKFIPNPFDQEGPRALMYKTGDLVRYRPDGNLEFLGRIDHQVKLRGIRIEPGEIECVLREHPAVQEALVVMRDEPETGKALVAYVVPRRAAEPGPASGDDAGVERIEQWRRVYEEIYRHGAGPEDVDLNTVGWNSSYTGLPIPAAEMLEQVEGTAGRLLALRPRRVLEIGCGMGLLLFRVAPTCERYMATDFAAGALQFVRHETERRGLKRVELQEREADDFAGIEEGTFDLVVLNSIVQYFPSIEYLVRVLEGAVRAVRPGGHVFVGDVRSRPLLEALAAGIEVERARAGASREEVRRRVERRVRGEQELVIDPEFFDALRNRVPGIGTVEVEVKRGRHHNELTRFRYDVVAKIGPATAGTDGATECEWAEIGDLAGLRQRLETLAGPLVVRRLPSARLQVTLRLLEWLHGTAGPATVARLREQMLALSDTGVEPEALWGLEAEGLWEVHVGWSETPGCHDAVVLPRVRRDARRTVVGVLGRKSRAAMAWGAYGNRPAGEGDVAIGPELRRHLRERLPEYMVPSAFVQLDGLPLTLNGKVDWRALPGPATARADREGTFVGPRSDRERTIAAAWQATLGLERVGVDDNFFDLGGHSLLLVRLHSRLQSALGVDLSLVDLFRFPTVGSLAQFLTRDGVEQAPLDAAHDRGKRQRQVMGFRSNPQQVGRA